MQETSDGRITKTTIRRDANLNEYRVIGRNASGQIVARYFTDDKSDAESTALAMRHPWLLLTNDALLDAYSDATNNETKELIGQAIRARVADGRIKPDAGARFYSGAPDYRCQRCGKLGGH